MADWHCVGDDNIAWKEGPYLSSGANRKHIDRIHQYCFRTSNESGAIGGIVMGRNPRKAENGGVQIPLPPKDIHESRVEPVISKLAIIDSLNCSKNF